MKTTKAILIILFCSIGITSCNDFLDITPPSEYTDKTFYLTPNDFELAIAATYSSLQTMYGSNGSAYMNTIMSRGDECRNFGITVSRFIDSPTQGDWKSSYSSIWSLIYRCNKIINRIDDVSFPDVTQKNNIKGEALAMRGWAFFQFAWCWGGVPLITQEYALSDLKKIARASQESTYKQAEQDLEQAYRLLPEVWSSSGKGRVSKYGAAGVLGRLYMFTKEYEKANIYFSYITTKEPSLFSLEPKYESIFSSKSNNSTEKVWEIQYVGGTPSENKNPHYISQSFCSCFIPSSLSTNDRRSDVALLFHFDKQPSPWTGPQSGVANSIIVSYSLADYHPSATDNTWVLGVWETDPNDATKIIDTRRNKIMINGLYGTNTTPTLDTYRCRKWLYTLDGGYLPRAIDEWGTNLPIIRYTDVILMRAEALNEINYNANIVEILSYINKVRARAGLSDLLQTDLPDKESVFQYLVKERFREFAFEAIRWPDLIRWGLAIDKLTEHFALTDEGFNTTTNTSQYKIEKYHLLAPIPYSEIVAYGNPDVMWQNQGY